MHVRIRVHKEAATQIIINIYLLIYYFTGIF